MNDANIAMSCQHCCFAQHHNDGEQSGCQLEMLHKLQDNDCLISLDEETKHFVLENRVCNRKRNQKWLDAQSEPEVAVRKEVEVAYDTIVLFQPKHNMDDLMVTLRSLERQKVKPKNVLIGVLHPTINPAIFLRLNTLSTLKWSAEFIIDEEAKADIKKTVDICVKKCKSRFYLPVYAGTKIDTDYIGVIDAYINDKLGRVLAVRSDELHPYSIMTRRLHLDMGGNARADVVEKVENEAEEQQCQSMIKNFNELL